MKKYEIKQMIETLELTRNNLNGVITNLKIQLRDYKEVEK